MAVCKAGALEENIPIYKHIANIAGVNEFVMPVPCFNVINGGVHAGNNLEIQEFMILPIEAKTFKQALQMGAETYHHLKNILKDNYGKDAVNVGDEGGFAPPVSNPEEAISLLMQAIDKAGYKGKIEIALDCAASEFYKDGKYILQGKDMTGNELTKYYVELTKKYPIISIEDPFDQDDFDSYAKLTREIGKDVQIVGDDLLVTNSERIQRAIHHGACNTLLLKVNQIGSVTEAIEACQLSQQNGWGVMVSHRSGETEDTFIADLVVGLKTGQIKAGAPCRSERLAKYNQLLRIEEELGEKAKYAGKNFRKP
jgi:enolase